MRAGVEVEEAYLSSNHAFIRTLFSGVQGNGSSDERGHEHVTSTGVPGALQPPLIKPHGIDRR